MIHVLIRHKVADFTKWKVMYDSHAGKRQEAGFKEVKLLRSIDNPNEVFLVFIVPDLKMAQAFVGSPDLQETMKKAGVIDKPDVYFLN